MRKIFKNIGLALLVIGVIILIFAILDDLYKRGKKQGQIDAMTGKIEYELVINPDSTRTWEKIKK